MIIFGRGTARPPCLCPPVPALLLPPRLASSSSLTSFFLNSGATTKIFCHFIEQKMLLVICAKEKEKRGER
jgi:hypothetical protein